VAIDYAIEFPCVPRFTFGTHGIIDRLKARDRARTIIRLFRENGDERPPSEMGFEFTRSLPNGEEETRVIVVQEILDEAAQLDPLAQHCKGCPANNLGVPFGCTGFIQYPVSAAAERWLLDALPGIETPLVWLLLREGVQQMGYDGNQVKPLRANPTYFEEQRLMGRDMVEFTFSADQVFEMLFLLGDIKPPHAGMMLLFFNAIPREVEANQIASIMNNTLNGDEKMREFPFQMTIHKDDDKTVAELKDFFRSLYLAWTLNAPVTLDV
jgi:hypothetical protein